MSKKVVPQPQIVIVCRKIPPERSGAGLRVLNLAQKLYDKKLLSFIITQTAKEYQYGDNDLNKKVHRVRKFRKRKKTINNLLILFWDYLIIFKYVYRILYQNKTNYNLILCIGGGHLTLVTIIVGNLFLGKKIIVQTTLLKSTYDNLNVSAKSGKKLKYIIQRYLFRKVDFITNVSPALYSEYIKIGYNPKKLNVIFNPVDVNRFKPICETNEREIEKRKLELLDINSINHPVILFVGNIIKRKRVDIIVDAFELLWGKYKNSILLLVGDYEHCEGMEIKKNILTKASMKGYLNSIKFFGYRPDIEKFMQISDFLLFSSENEGLPNTLLEAIASGLPVIALRIKGITDHIIDNGVNGILIDNNTPTLFFEEIDKLINNNDLKNKIRKNARMNAIKNFSYEKILYNYIDLFNSLLK